MIASCSPLPGCHSDFNPSACYCGVIFINCDHGAGDGCYCEPDYTSPCYDLCNTDSHHKMALESTIPDKIYLYQNYPNPFNPSTSITFDLPKVSYVKLEVYDISGEKVAEIINTVLNTGRHKYSFDASSYASGIYIYKLTAGDFTDVKKMMLIK